MILHVLIARIAGWINRHQQQVIAYLQGENRVLKAQHGGRRLRLTDTERCRRAVLAYPLGRQRLKEIAALATPDTLIRWYKRLIADKFDGSKKRKALGRPRISEEVEQIVMCMAQHRGIPSYFASWGWKTWRDITLDCKILLVYVTGSEDTHLMVRNEYLVSENGILHHQIKGRLHLSDTERTTLAEIGEQPGKEAPEESPRLPSLIPFWAGIVSWCHKNSIAPPSAMLSVDPMSRRNWRIWSCRWSTSDAPGAMIASSVPWPTWDTRSVCRGSILLGEASLPSRYP